MIIPESTITERTHRTQLLQLLLKPGEYDSDLCCPNWQPLGTCGDGALEMWLDRIEMCLR